jgi:hypothetical protein
MSTSQARSRPYPTAAAARLTVTDAVNICHGIIQLADLFPEVEALAAVGMAAQVATRDVATQGINKTHVVGLRAAANAAGAEAGITEADIHHRLTATVAAAA